MKKLLFLIASALLSVSVWAANFGSLGATKLSDATTNGVSPTAVATNETPRLSQFEMPVLKSMKLSGTDIPNGIANEHKTGIRKAPSAGTVKISGLVDASTIADNSAIELVGNANLFMDANKTFKSISGDYTLTISGGNSLTLDNSGGYAINVESVSISAPVRVTSSYIAISAQNGITINANVEANSTNTCIGTLHGDITINANVTAITTSSAAILNKDGHIIINSGTTTATGGTSGDWAWGIAATGRITSAEGTTINATGGTAIYSEQNYINFAGSVTATAKGAKGYGIYAKNANVSVAEANIPQSYIAIGAEHDININGTTVANSTNTCIGTIDGTIIVNADLTATTTSSAALLSRQGRIAILSGTTTATGGTTGDWAYAIAASARVSSRAGTTVNANGGTAIYAENGEISLSGTINAEATKNVIYAKSASSGNITINGNLTAETTGEDSYAVVGKNITLNGGTMTITSVANAVVSNGDMILSGNISASATSESSGAFNTRDGGNLIIKDGSTITGIAAGFGIYAAGNISMAGGSLVARGYTGTAIQSQTGYISLTGTINTKGLENAIYAQSASNGNITVNGNLTAETTGDTSYGVVGKNITLNGGTMNITAVANAVVSNGNMKLSGNITATSTKATSVALNARDGGNIIFGKGDYKISGAGQAVYAAGQIAFNTSLAILTPTNGKIYGNTIVDSSNNEATYVHIGYTPKVTQNTITTPTTIKYGEQVRIDGKITAVGQTTYKLQESADGATWRTIKSGTIATDDARAGKTIQYKKVLVETGYEACRQYRLIATHVASGEQDTSAIKRIYYKYPLLKDGLLTAYYSAGEVFHFAKPADCRDYRYTSQLPAQVAEYNDYLSITMPASSLYIDEYTPTYQVDFYDADATLLKTEEVIAGNDATPPSMGGHSVPGMRKTPSSTFTGWDKDYTNVHKQLKVFAKYDVYVDLDMDVVEHTCNSTEEWKFASWMFTQFENNKTMAMAGDQLTFRASVKTNTPVDVYFQAGTILGNGEISWTTGQHVGEITGYDVNKVMTFDRQVTALVEYYNELPFEKARYYRFFAKGNGTADTIYSAAMEIQMYYPLLVNAEQEVQVLTSDGGFYFNGLRSIIPVQYNETVLILDRQGLKGTGLTFARVNKPAYLTEGYTTEGVHYIVGPGETETLNVTTTKKLIVFDGVYGNGYPKQLDFTAEGFGKLNGYYGEVVPCGGSVTMPEDPTEENAIFLGWTSWDPSSYDSVAYLNVPAINENILGFTANFEYYDPTPQYTVRFYGKDGTPLLDTQLIDEGADATPPAAPVVSGWHFAGWDKPYTTITANTDITALYGEDIKVWTVTYKNWDGSSLGSEQVNDGEAAVGVDVEREGYTFVKWRDYFSGDDVDMEHITANVTVEPVFTETLYTVTYRVDGVVTYTIQVVDGFTASSIYYPYGTPTKEVTEALVYTFDYWTPEVETVTEDVTFDAVFVPTARQYTVTFQDWDHTLLSEQQVAYGGAATAPAEPARLGYFFDGWDREFDVTMADMTVTAMFRLPCKYIISWLDDDDSLIDQTIVMEGDIPTHADPTKQATAEFTYTFAGWTPEVVAVTGDATYTATYNETVNQYTITATAENGTVQGTGTYDYGTVVELTAVANDGYKFDKWSDDVTDNPRTVTVTENMAFTALFVLNGTTAIEDIHATEPAQKVLMDGILYIALPDGKVYNATGEQVK